MLQKLTAMPWEEVNEHLRRKVVHGERMSVTIYDFAAGGTFPRHTHDQEQVTYVLDGMVTFTIGDDVHDVSKGNLIMIPPGAIHDARADAPARVVSVVSPSRRDDSGISYVRPRGRP